MTEIVTVTGKCVMCARWGNVQGASDTIRWKLCDIPAPAIERPIREFEFVSGKTETRIVGYEPRPGGQLLMPTVTSAATSTWP